MRDPCVLKKIESFPSLIMILIRAQDDFLYDDVNFFFIHDFGKL